MKMKKRSRKQSQALVRKLHGTSSSQRIKNYILGLVEDAAFQQRILEIRAKYDLPPTGIAKRDIKYITMPRGPRSRIVPFELDKWTTFTEEVNSVFEKEYGLFPNWSSHTMREYILYNTIEWPTTGNISLCRMYDLRRFLTDEQLEMSDEDRFERLKYRSIEYPVAILINPYVSERDIIEYIKDVYRLGIKPLQEKYRFPHIRLGKVRKRSGSKKKRNEFIFQNRNKGSKTIVRLVREHFGQVMDYSHVSRIILAEKKKRGIRGK